MALIYSNYPDQLVAGVAPYGAISTLAISGVDPATNGFIFTGYNLSGSLRTKTQYTIGPVVYYYVFGANLSTLEISGVAFNTKCQPPYYDGNNRFLEFIALNNVANAAMGYPKLLIRMDTAGTLFSGALEQFAMAKDPRTPLLNVFKFRLVGAFVNL